MKNLKLTMVMLLLLSAAACRKSTPYTPSAYDPNGNAVNLIAGSLAINSNGVAITSSNVVFTSQTLVNQQLACGSSKTDTVSQQSAPGAATTYSYRSTYKYTLNCSGTQPDNTSVNSVYNGSYSNANFSSTNAGSTIYTTTGLSSASTTAVVNGEFIQTGSFQSKTNSSNGGSHTMDIVLKNLTFTKATHNIASGNATISVSQTQTGQSTITYSGTLVFNGDNTATLVLNSIKYVINLNTGIATKS